MEILMYISAKALTTSESCEFVLHKEGLWLLSILKSFCLTQRDSVFPYFHFQFTPLNSLAISCRKALEHRIYEFALC